MAVVPKRKKSKSCRNMHRSHHALEPANLSVDQTTGELKLSHHISNGYYKGRLVIVPKATEEAADSDSDSEEQKN